MFFMVISITLLKNYNFSKRYNFFKENITKKEHYLIKINENNRPITRATRMYRYNFIQKK